MTYGTSVMSKNDVGRAMVRGTAWSLIDNFARQAITFIVFIALARILTPEIFGLLTVAMLIVQVFKSVVFDSIATAVVRKANPTLTDYNTAFWMCQVFSVPAFLILFFTAGSVELWIGTAGLASVIKATSFIILTSGITRLHEVWLTHALDFRSLALRSFVAVTVGGIVGVFMAYKGYGIESLIAQQLVTSAIEFLMLWFITPWRPKAIVSRSSFKEIINFSKHVALTGVTNFANQNSDAFFVTYYLGATATGIYATGKRITNTMNAVIASSLLRVSLPAFSKLQHDSLKLRETYLNSTALTAMVTAPIFTGLSILSKDITLLILGDKWLESVPVMQIVTVIGFLTSIGYYNQSIMLVKNKPQWQTRLTFLYAFSNIVAFIIFTRYGLLYTALAFSLRALLLYPVSAWCALKLTGLTARRYLSSLVPALFSSLIMAFVMVIALNYLIIPSLVLKIFIFVLIGFITYVTALYLTIPLKYKSFAQTHLNRIFNRKDQNE